MEKLFLIIILFLNSPLYSVIPVNKFPLTGKYLKYDVEISAYDINKSFRYSVQLYVYEYEYVMIISNQEETMVVHDHYLIDKVTDTWLNGKFEFVASFDVNIPHAHVTAINIAYPIYHFQRTFMYDPTPDQQVSQSLMIDKDYWSIELPFIDLGVYTESGIAEMIFENGKLSEYNVSRHRVWSDDSYPDWEYFMETYEFDNFDGSGIPGSIKVRSGMFDHENDPYLIVNANLGSYRDLSSGESASRVIRNNIHGLARVNGFILNDAARLASIESGAPSPDGSRNVDQREADEIIRLNPVNIAPRIGIVGLVVGVILVLGGVTLWIKNRA